MIERATFGCGQLFDTTEVPKDEVGFVDEECVLFELKLPKTVSLSGASGAGREEKKQRKQKRKEDEEEGKEGKEGKKKSSSSSSSSNKAAKRSSPHKKRKIRE